MEVSGLMGLPVSRQDLEAGQNSRRFPDYRDHFPWRNQAAFKGGGIPWHYVQLTSLLRPHLPNLQEFPKMELATLIWIQYGNRPANLQVATKMKKELGKEAEIKKKLRRKGV